MRPNVPVSWPLACSLLAILLGLGVIATAGYDVLRTAVAPTGTEDRPDELLEANLKRSELALAQYRERIDGRSPFYVPPIRPKYTAPPPPPPPPPPKTDQPVEPVEPSLRPAPARYPGPRIVFVVGEEVWFERPSDDEPHKRMTVGQTMDEYELVSIDHPRSIKIAYTKEGHERGEYDVPIFGDWNVELIASEPAAGEPATVKGLVEFEDDPEAAEAAGLETDPTS